MCKHAAHTTDDENSWIEYFLVQHEQGTTLTFPALSAHVQDGRRGKVSAIAKQKKKPGNPHPPTVILPVLPSLHQDTTLDSLPTPAFTAQETPLFSWFDFCTNRHSGITVDSSLKGLTSECLQFNISLKKKKKKGWRAESSRLLPRPDKVFIAKQPLFPEKCSAIDTHPWAWKIPSALSLALPLMCWCGFYNGLSASLLSRR